MRDKTKARGNFVITVENDKASRVKPDFIYNRFDLWKDGDFSPGALQTLKHESRRYSKDHGAVETLHIAGGGGYLFAGSLQRKYGGARHLAAGNFQRRAARGGAFYF